MDEGLPLYQRIKSQLKKQISEMRPNDRIPSENDLVRIHSVSRGTAKQAITELVYEGFLYRVQGKGTFVSPPKINRDFIHLPSFTSDIVRHGKTASNKVIYFGTVEAPFQIAEKLGIPPDTPLLRYKRVVMVDDEPLALVCSYLRSDRFPDLELEDARKSLYAALMNHYGIAPQTAVDTYSVLLASRKTANHLKIGENDPLLYSERISFLADSEPIEYVESFIRADKYQLTIFAGQDTAGNQITKISSRLSPR